MDGGLVNPAGMLVQKVTLPPPSSEALSLGYCAIISMVNNNTFISDHTASKTTNITHTLDKLEKKIAYSLLDKND